MFEFIGGLNGDDYCPYDEDGMYIPGEDGENYITHTRRSTKCNTCGSMDVYSIKSKIFSIMTEEELRMFKTEWGPDEL